MMVSAGFFDAKAPNELKKFFFLLFLEDLRDFERLSISSALVE